MASVPQNEEQKLVIAAEKKKNIKPAMCLQWWSWEDLATQKLWVGIVEYCLLCPHLMWYPNKVEWELSGATEADNWELEVYTGRNTRESDGYHFRISKQLSLSSIATQTGVIEQS